MSRGIDLLRIGSLKSSDVRSARFQCSNLCSCRREKTQQAFIRRSRSANFADPPSLSFPLSLDVIIILICHLFVSPLVIHVPLFFNEEAAFRTAQCHNFFPPSHLHRMPLNDHENCRDCMIVTPTFRRIRYLNAISVAIIVTSKSTG